MIKSLTQQLHILKIIDVNCGDKAYDQYGEIIQKIGLIDFDNDDCWDDLFSRKLIIQNFPDLV